MKSYLHCSLIPSNMEDPTSDFAEFLQEFAADDDSDRESEGFELEDLHPHPRVDEEDDNMGVHDDNNWVVGDRDPPP